MYIWLTFHLKVAFYKIYDALNCHNYYCLFLIPPLSFLLPFPSHFPSSSFIFLSLWLFFYVFSFYVSFAYLSYLWCCSFIKLLTWYTPMLLLLTDYFLFLNVLLLVVVVVIVLFSPTSPLSLSLPLPWFLFVWLNQQVLPFLFGQHLFRGSNIVSYLYSLVRDFNFQNSTFFFVILAVPRFHLQRLFFYFVKSLGFYFFKTSSLICLDRLVRIISEPWKRWYRQMKSYFII